MSDQPINMIGFMTCISLPTQITAMEIHLNQDIVSTRYSVNINWKKGYYEYIYVDTQLYAAFTWSFHRFFLGGVGGELFVSFTSPINVGHQILYLLFVMLLYNKKLVNTF